MLQLKIVFRDIAGNVYNHYTFALMREIFIFFIFIAFF